MNALPYTITPRSISVFVDGDQASIADTHPNFQAVKAALKEGRWGDVAPLINVSQVVREFLSGSLELINGQIFYNGEPQTGSVVDHILRLKAEGFDIKPLLAFFERLQKNSSLRVRNDVFDWLLNGQMPISPDGYVIAFKKVRDNYRDVHSGTFDNSVGKICEVPRHKVDDNFNNTCSHGLHFCSRGYLPHFPGERIMVVKIDPADIVAFPTDYNLAKGRCSKYEVIEEIANTDTAGEQLTDAVYGDDDFDDGWDDNETADPCPFCGAEDEAGPFCSACGADLG